MTKNRKLKRLGRRVLSCVLAFVMVFSTLAGTAPGMSLTAYAASYSVTITKGEHMTHRTGSGDASQNGVDGPIIPVVYTADEGYYFPTDYSVTTVNGISVGWISYTHIIVYGTPTDNTEITLTAPTEKNTPDAPTTAAAVNCTTASNNDGKLTGVATSMEYKKSDAENWTDGTGSDITGLLPGTYYVRYKATDTALNSGNQELTILEYEKTAAAVIVKIDAIPATITWDDKVAVYSAWNAYSGLSAAQKELINEASVNKLTDLIEAVDVAESIYFLHEENNVRPADVEDIHEARAAYDALTVAQKAIVDDTVIAKLTACEAALITTIVDYINGISAITESNKDAVRELLESYDKLTNAEKDSVYTGIGKNGTKKKKLSDLEKALEVTDKIDMLDSPDDIDSADEKEITLARTAYELLSDTQKNMVPGGSYAKLEAAEEKLDQIKADSAAAEAAAKAAAEEAAKLVAARESALDRLRDYADAKALSDATDAEKTDYNNALDDGIQVITDAENNVTAIAAALTTAKALVDDALAQIKNDRAADAAAAAEAAKLNAAKENAIERLDAYSEVKALSDATEAEKETYDQVVTNGRNAIDTATDTDAVTAALTAAKAAVDNALNQIKADRAAAAAAAQEMAAADKALEDAIAGANDANSAAGKALDDEYISEADKSIINGAKGTLTTALAMKDALDPGATAENKNDVAVTINDCAGTLKNLTVAVNIRSAAARTAAEAAAAEEAKLNAAKETAIERLDAYSEVKALSDANDDERAAYDQAVSDGKAAINAAENKDAVTAALTDAKSAVDTALNQIKTARAEAEAAAQKMAAADASLNDAVAAAGDALKEADKAASDQYASDNDKSSINEAKSTVTNAISAANNLASNATADQKNTAAVNINNAVNDLITATDTANIHSAAARADAEAEADRAAKLAAAKKYAIERLFDYSGAKALSDATVAEQIYYAQAVADGELAINATTTEAAVAEKLTDAKKAVDDALAKIKKDRAEAEAAAQKMAAADASLNNAVAAAGYALKEADEAASDQYASADDKSAIGTAKSTVAAALDASVNLAPDATAEQKNAIARDINNAVNDLITATDAANLNSAIARAEAEAEADRAAKLNAAKAAAIDRLNDYAGAKALSDATVAEQLYYLQAVADGGLAIYAATTETEVTEKLSDAKKAVDAALAKIKKDRAEAEAAAQEMAAANKALEDAIAAANDAIAAANEAAADEYASDDDKSAIGTAKGKAASLLDASVNFAADATAEQKNAVARDINNAVNDLITVTDTAIINSAETKAEADAAADFAAKLEAAKTYAIERLDDYSEVKALSDATEAEKAAYDQVVSDGKAAINEAEDKEAVAAALTAAKSAVNEVLSLIKNDRAAAAAADTTSAKTGLVYNENEQELVTAPSMALPSGYTMKYAVTTENKAPTDELYTTAIPTAANAGTYYVWYFVTGEDGFATAAKSITVTIEDVGSKLNAEKAKKNNLAALGDDTMIVPDATGKVWTLDASINDASSNVVRVKVTFTVGAKVKLNGYDKMLSEQFRIENSYSKQTATISKKGILKAKKVGTGILQYSTADGKTVRIEYTVVKPAIAIADGKDASVNNLAPGSVKKLKATYTAAGNFDVKLTGVPLNSKFTFKGTKILNESNIVIGKDGCLHITGVLESKKTSKVIINAQGKKYTVVIRGKF